MSSAREKLLQAALTLFRARGYAATSVDALCQAAGVTKGAFFHHFASKDALGAASARYWSHTTADLFAQAAYHQAQTPRERVLAYLDLRLDLVEGELAAFTCLAGTIVQEAYATSPDIRAACQAAIFDHAGTLEADIAAALASAGHPAGISAASLAQFTQSAIQGGFILAKAANDAAPAREAIAHTRRYLAWLLTPTGEAAGEVQQGRE